MLINARNILSFAAKSLARRVTFCKAFCNLFQVVIANRDMGSTAVLRVAATETEGMGEEEKRRWCAEHGKRLHDEVIQKYRASMPKSVR